MSDFDKLFELKVDDVDSAALWGNDTLNLLAKCRHNDRETFERLWQSLRAKGVKRLRELETEIKRRTEDLLKQRKVSGYQSGSDATGHNTRVFLQGRKARIVTSDDVSYTLGPDGVWRELKPAELRAEIRQTDQAGTLSVSAVRAMVGGVADQTFVRQRPFEWLNPPPEAPRPEDLVAFRNGLLDLRSGKLLPHDGSYFLTALPEVEYDQEATCQHWMEWLGTQLDELYHPVLQEMFGYFLVPEATAHRLFSLIGPPRTGKSTAKKVVTRLVGEAHVASKQLADLGSAFGLEDLLDRRLMVVPDAKNVEARVRGLALERILAITGGDEVGIQRKYRTPVYAKLVVRLLWLGNRQPAWLDESGALAARLIQVTFTNSFAGREDQTVEEALLRELPGIAVWALEGLRRLRANNYSFSIGDLGAEEVAEVKRSQSPALRFLEDRLEVTGNPEDTVQTDEVYDAYLDWARMEGEKTRSKNDLLDDLHTADARVKRTQRRLSAPEGWTGKEFRPRVLSGVRRVHRVSPSWGASP